MKIFWVTFAVIFLPLQLIATDINPEQELIVPIGLTAVEQAVVRETDDIQLTVYSGNPSDSKTWKGVTGRDFHIETTYATDISFLIKEKTRELLSFEGSFFLQKGSKYFIRFSLSRSDWKNGYKKFMGYVLTDDITSTFVFDVGGGTPEIAFRVNFTKYYVPISNPNNRVKWVRVLKSDKTLSYESANGAPPYCNLVYSAGDGYLYLGAGELAYGPSVFEFYGDTKKTTLVKRVEIKFPKMMVIPLSVAEYRLLGVKAKSAGARIEATTLAGEEVVFETTTDFKTWELIGTFPTDKWGVAEVDYFGPPGFFRAHTVK